MKQVSQSPGKQTSTRAGVRTALTRLATLTGSRQARWLILGLFVAQAVLLACVIRIGTPPDENNHIRFIEYYANHSLSPIFDHQQPTYNLGDKTREVDYLYHYSMSLIYRILPLATSTKYIVIRLFSVGVGLATCITLCQIMRRLKVSDAAINVSLLVLTNLPMVLFMSAAINNDALVWLGVALAILLLLKLWTKPSWFDLLLLAEIVIVGGLVKRTMLPFDAVFGILGASLFIRHWKQFIRWPTKLDWHIIAIAGVLVVSSGLALERIGGNIVRYHTPTPSCEQVQGVQPCSVFWVNVRARSQTALPPQPQVSLPVFVPFWAATSIFNIVDIQTQGWRHEVMPPTWLAVGLGGLLMIGLGYGLYVDGHKWQDRLSRHRVYVTSLGLSVVLIHLAYNFQDYQSTHIFGQGLNGRYILPGLLPLGLLATYYWSRLLARRRLWTTALAVMAIVATIGFSGLIMMLRNPQLLHG